MASSSKPKGIYDVFLSFRGTDVRNNFLGHLKNALDQKGICTFLDNLQLKKGDRISSALMEAIKESRIAIIVFSKDYASSQWCLEELATIMEWKEEKHLFVMPVFYKVEPREVRAGRGSYRRALAKQESTFGKDSAKVKRWKKALFDAGNLSGWHLNNEDESKIIQQIVNEVFITLDRTLLYVAKHPVGIDSQVVKLKSMLNLEFDDGVVMVGLWGLGGIGKSSLAKALYNAIRGQFESSCFLADVRENSKGCRGLATLQGILLKDVLLWQQRLEVSDVNRGIKMIQQRLCCKKVLLILDDVDDLCQLNCLAGKDEWFGNGSRIIVTTRDKHLLTCHGIDQNCVYEVKALDDSDARELLSKHAFPTHQQLKIRIELVDSILNHAKGLPLALEVLGSFLCGRREHEWESTLRKLSRIPNKTINDVLKISYDGLEEDCKEIFLHIACFFKGWDSEYVMKVLDNLDLETTIGLEILIDRSLMSIRNGMLQMHDLIQLMGMDIVKQDCRDNPKRQSRVWLYDDVLDVLQHKGDCAVKAIVLEPPEPIEIFIDPYAFTKMTMLRLLIVRNVSCQVPLYLPERLRWFRWDGCALWIPKFSSIPNKLVGLDMRGSSMSIVPNLFKGFQTLTYINFSHCESLIHMPDLLYTPNLKELDLHNCKNLVKAHESLAYHDKLQVLHLRECSALSVFPKVLKSKSLRTLNLEKCTKFERFPDIPHKLEGLKNLYLRETAIKGLPASIENLVSLKKLDIYDCKNLLSLPSSIYELQTLEELQVECCTNLIEFPKYEGSMKTGLSNLHSLNLAGCNLSKIEFLDNLSCFPFLRHLELSKNNITSLPPSINRRDRLSRLAVENCHQLQEIPKLPPFLRYLWADNCESLQKSGHLTLIHDFVHRGLTMAGISPLDEIPPDLNIFLNGGEMPEWILPIEEDSVSFMASKDIYDKFLGLAICFLLDYIEPEKEPMFKIFLHVNGERRDCKEGQTYWALDSNHMWLRYFTPYDLWGEVDFGQIDGSYVQFSLTVSTTNVKNWGLQIICKPLEDNLKVMLQDNWLLDLALLREVVLESIDLEAGISLMHEHSSIKMDLQKDLQDCQMSVKQHNQIVLKKNHEVFSDGACEPRPCGLLIRLTEMSTAMMAMFGCCFSC